MRVMGNKGEMNVSLMRDIKHMLICRIFINEPVVPEWQFATYAW